MKGENDDKPPGEQSEPRPRLRNWPALHVVEKRAQEEPPVVNKQSGSGGDDAGSGATEPRRALSATETTR